VRAYLDTSVLVSLLWNDAHTSRALAYIAAARPSLVVSDLAEAEFAATAARLVRMAAMTHDEALALFGLFDAWTAREGQRVAAMPADMALATAWIRRLDLNLRAPDALHIALADRLDGVLVTFDAGMAAAALALGVTVAEA
jgi:uncharacterized protein